MKYNPLPNLFLDQSEDHIWMVNPNLELIYANKSYLNLIEKLTGKQKKLNEPVLDNRFSKNEIRKWEAYYYKALNGEYFEIEDQHVHLGSKEIQYSRVTFSPITGDDQKISAVACQSRSITTKVNKASDASQMLDSSLDVFCTIDVHGNFTYINAAALPHWGYLPEELIGTAYMDLILEEDLPKTSAAAASVFEGHDIKSFVNRYKKKNGDIAYNLWSVRWDPTTKLLYCVARDGKEKIEHEEEVQESEQRFRALVQEGSDLIGIIDLEGNYNYVSPTSTSILGISPEEFIGRNAFEFIHPDDAARTLESIQKTPKENRVTLKPFRFQNSKNEWRWIETVFTNMLDNPSVNGIVANSRDITDQIEEKHKLKLLESVITNTNDAILITEAEPQNEPGPRIIYVNEAFTKMTGYTAEDVIGKSPRILQGPNSDEKELAKLGHSLRNWEPYEITTINYKKNGEEFWVNFTVTPVADEKGWFTHWIAIERDVTEQKNKELETELLAQISVDFNAENDYLSAVYELCKSISKFGNFDWVEIWTTNLEKNQLQLFSNYMAAPNDEIFYSHFPAIKKLYINEGLPGEVWSKKTQVLWNEVDKHKDFIRSEAAAEIGLKSVLGIPLIFNEEVLGVLQIGTKRHTNHLKNYTRVFQKLQGFIGSELNRKNLENDLSQLFNAIPDIICVLDIQGRILKMNKAGCDLLGYSEEEILYHTLNNFLLPADKYKSFDELLSPGHGVTSFKFENRCLSKNGEIVWLSWYCNSANEEGLIYAAAQNITEAKKLRELNRQAGRLAKIGSWELDLVNNSLFWSDEVHQLTETDPQSFIPNTEIAINFYREDFQQTVRSHIQKCISTGESFDYEAVLVTSKKKEKWVRCIGNAEFSEFGCKRIYGSFQDISSLKNTENRLLSLSENLPGIVYQYLIHPDGTDSFRYVSGTVEQLYGFTPKQIMENPNLIWDQVKAAGGYEEVQKSILKSIQSKSKWTSRIKYMMPSGELRTNLGYGTPTFLANGTILFNSIVLDITQDAKNEELLEQYTKELERSNEELEQFAFIASHDLQEPLRMVSSFMDLIQRKYGDLLDEKGHQYIHFATDGAKRMKQIILDLLDYSRANKLTDGIEEIDLNEIVSEFKQLRRKLITTNNAKIMVQDLPVLHTYKAAVTQILHCLLDNAIKYTVAGTTPIIEIIAKENKIEWKFSIKDNGIGIDTEFYEKIFGIFQRLHTQDQYSGTGIGLSIAKRHVEFLGGKIWLESKLNKGTIFYFTIPKIM